LTSSARLGEKLKLAARRLSDAAGYVGVRFLVEERLSPSAQGFLITSTDDGVGATSELWSSEIAELVRRARRPVFIDDLTTDPRIPPRHRTFAKSRGVGPGLCAPMSSQGEVVGFISVAAGEGITLDARDARLVAAVGEQVTAIARLDTLVDTLQTSATRIGDARADTVIMLAAAAEAHDSTTGRHLTRVREASELLAIELGWSETDARALGLAAVLHDIGKIRVPDSILASPARLNGEEWVAMKQHTVWGAEFLRQRPGFELAAEVAFCHHEQWDGSGYPNGLAANEIPLAATVVSVADSLDAITSDRPYRPGKPLAWAVDEIEAWSGRQFNPAVVEALCRLHQSGKLDFLTTDSAEDRRAA
jgi:putative nucleotidyltransferase with HDIG domain